MPTSSTDPIRTVAEARALLGLFRIHAIDAHGDHDWQMWSLRLAKMLHETTELLDQAAHPSTSGEPGASPEDGCAEHMVTGCEDCQEGDTR